MTTVDDKQRYDDLEKQKEDLYEFMNTKEYKDSYELQLKTLTEFVVLCEHQQEIIPYPYVKKQKFLLIKNTLRKAIKVRNLITEGLIDAEKVRSRMKKTIEKAFKRDDRKTKGGFRR